MPYASQITRFIWPQYKLHLHLVQILLTAVIMILAIVKLVTLTSTAPRTRSNTVALAMVRQTSQPYKATTNTLLERQVARHHLVPTVY